MSQTIDSAPKDSPILGYLNERYDKPRWVVVAWDEKFGDFYVDDTYPVWPTHWHELPPDPTP